MQTFLPYEDFGKSAKVLDSKRLNKQIVEGVQIIHAIQNKRRGIKSGWQNHPCTRMWENHIEALIEYTSICGIEWEKRKGKTIISDFLYESASEGVILKPGFFCLDNDSHKSLRSLIQIEFFVPNLCPNHMPSFIGLFPFLESLGLADLPKWIGDPRFHLSHQANLVRKDPEHYSKHFPDADPTMPYYWPI